MILLILFLVFFKIGAVTFGGGTPMLAFVQAEALKAGWLNETEIMNFVAVSESTPGPFAINMSTYVGMKTAGLSGAFFATLGVVVPSFVIILIIAKFYEKFMKSHVVEGIMSGLRPTVVGLILSAVITMGKSIMQGELLGLVLFFIIFIVMFVLLMKKKSPIFVIVLSAGIGIAVGYLSEWTGIVIL